ncbi:uncharacterized protein P884DRAFT_257584 [Thermothelomyces heterothallicus CBS 202.75]|uniref:uncharacterized protein n=1 Tax=Thermothelomyces heterothallicus CBS 202.75 TaxID=1149848 RepID=UPI003742693A
MAQQRGEGATVVYSFQLLCIYPIPRLSCFFIWSWPATGSGNTHGVCHSSLSFFKGSFLALSHCFLCFPAIVCPRGKGGDMFLFFVSPWTPWIDRRLGPRR